MSMMKAYQSEVIIPILKWFFIVLRAFSKLCTQNSLLSSSGDIQDARDQTQVDYLQCKLILLYYLSDLIFQTLWKFDVVCRLDSRL